MARVPQLLRSDEEEILAETLKRYALDELLPDFSRWRHEPYPRSKVEALGALGVLGMAIPEEFGGSGAPPRGARAPSAAAGCFPARSEPGISPIMGRLEVRTAMARFKTGSRIRSAVCNTEAMVIAAPDAEVEISCGGVPVIEIGAEPPA